MNTPADLPFAEAIPSADQIRPLLIQAQQRADWLRRLLQLALDRETTPDQIMRLQDATKGANRARR